MTRALCWLFVVQLPLYMALPIAYHDSRYTDINTLPKTWHTICVELQLLHRVVEFRVFPLRESIDKKLGHLIYALIYFLSCEVYHRPVNSYCLLIRRKSSWTPSKMSLGFLHFRILRTSGLLFLMITLHLGGAISFTQPHICASTESNVFQSHLILLFTSRPSPWHEGHWDKSTAL